MPTVLVMDDDSVMRDLFRMHLGNAGYEVLLAEDAVAAGHLVVRQRPDLIIADVDMPFMSGIDFVQALKADPSVADIPVIFVSSRTDYEDEGKRAGAVAFIAKPLRADRLLSAVARHIEGGGPVPL